MDSSPGGPDRLAHAIDHAAHLLPAQGPITVFIHHNTLHAFEGLTFDQAVRRGGEVFGCQPYLPEDRFRAELARGRIRPEDLRAVLQDDLKDRADDIIAGLGRRSDVRLAMLEYPVWAGPAAELDFIMAEADVLKRVHPDVPGAARERLVTETRHWVMRDHRGPTAPAWALEILARFGTAHIESWTDDVWEAVALETLWHLCLKGVGRSAPRPTSTSFQRHRDLLVRMADVDPDLWVHGLLIRYCAAFLDQGISHWPLPGQREGLYKSFLRLYARPAGLAEDWQTGLQAEAERLLTGNVAALESVAESLRLLGVAEDEWDEYLSETLLALRGWGGMVRQVETRGDRVAHRIPPGSLVDFVAVRLLLDRLAVGHAAKTALGYTGPLAGLRDDLRPRLPADEPPTAAQRAFPVFQLAQLLGRTPAELASLTPGEWAVLFAEVEGFSGVERRRVFHLAYERRFRVQTLDAVALHTPADEFGRLSRTGGIHETPRFQLVTCIDEREESFRRHLEEVAPDCETFGAPGFFGVVMYHRGVGDAHFIPLCPIVVTPRHYVAEKVEETVEPEHRRRARTRRALGKASLGLNVGTRSFLGGAILSAGLGVLATVPLVARVLFPRLTARFRRRLTRIMQAPGRTELRLERTAADPGPTDEGLGYSVAEMTDIAEQLLRDIGLVEGFAKLVFFLGHGSHSLNNPHESAHDCGACGGAVGGPNGRAIAQIFNDPRIRAGLVTRGITIPDDTVFVGGLHNTCNEYIKLPDADRVPASHAALFAAALKDIEEALDRHSHERARRFDTAPLSISKTAARQHMDERAEDLAQVRPEWGHATNAICIVGRRARTRGLFFDRRAFFNSYDPTRDDADGTILARILGAAVPVCGGISLEYYFSHVDNPGYGCGTKLPHNITSLLGVMDGAASDLRTGLPWQMVEIHEPVRILFVVESPPAVLLGIMDRNPTIGTLVRNGWVQMSVLDPRSNAIRVFRDGAFHPYEPTTQTLPHAPTSADWYRGWRDHLPFAAIGGPP